MKPYAHRSCFLRLLVQVLILAGLAGGCTGARGFGRVNPDRHAGAGQDFGRRAP